MRIVDIHPTRGWHAPGQAVQLRAETEGADGGVLRAAITHLGSAVAMVEQPVVGAQSALVWQPPPGSPRGYGVEAELVDGGGRLRDQASTAFDVLARWTDFPRYGFLSDFPPGRADLAQAVGHLARHHVNGLQFYDWQYRHDHLVAPTEVYEDPLARKLSRSTIRDAIAAAHAAGMAAMAYVAVYGASAAFWRARPDWALRGADGEPLRFGDDFLGLMNPSRGSPWARHLREQCAAALAEAGFDGIHVDQYGEPREARDADGRGVDLPAAFADFVADLKERHPEAPITMNAVKNWPIDALVGAPQDFVYIELWPDTPTYRELLDIVADARAQSGRAVVVALYLPAGHTANILTADAILLAAGASRIELGEGRRLLTDPYFPNHEALPADLDRRLRRCHDLAVRYGELIGPAAVRAHDVEVQAPPGVWALAHRGVENLAIAVVNMTGLEGARWDQPHAPPELHKAVELTVVASERVTSAWCASPGSPAPRPVGLDRRTDGVRLTVPALEHLSIVSLQTEREAGG